MGEDGLGGDARALGQVAQRCGVNVVPGQSRRPVGRHADRLRLPFVHDPGVIAEVVRRLSAWEIYSGAGRAPRSRSASSSRRPAARRPSSTVTARPESSTRSPRSSTPTVPPRAEACGTQAAHARGGRPRGCPRAQWAEPVTGSSGMPTDGAK